MSKHANSYDNEAEHHLYEVYDTERDTTFKYGICGDPLNDDGSSDRATEQAEFFNRIVGYFRFFATVLLAGIAGRRQARQIEDDHIEAYRQKHGKFPEGNQNHKKYRG